MATATGHQQAQGWPKEKGDEYACIVLLMTGWVVDHPSKEQREIRGDQNKMKLENKKEIRSSKLTLIFCVGAVGFPSPCPV